MKKKSDPAYTQRESEHENNINETIESADKNCITKKKPSALLIAIIALILCVCIVLGIVFISCTPCDKNDDNKATILTTTSEETVSTTADHTEPEETPLIPSVVPVSPEDAVNIYMNNISQWSGAKDYILRDINFDGVVDIIARYTDAGEYNKVYTINPHTKEFEAIDSSPSNGDEFFDYCNSYYKPLFKNESDGSMFYYIESYNTLNDNETITISGKCYADNVLREEKLFYNYCRNSSSETDEVNVYKIYKNNDWVEVDEYEYNTEKNNFEENHTNMECTSQRISASELTNVTEATQHRVLLEAYYKFGYNGFYLGEVPEPEFDDIVISKENKSLYLDILNKHISEITSYGTSSSFLYDYDSDDIYELVIHGSYPGRINNTNISYDCFSVYDIENGKLAEKIYKEPLFPEAGGPSGEVGIAEYNGEIVLVAKHRGGSTSGNAHRVESYTIYDRYNLDIMVEASKDFNWITGSDETNFNYAEINDIYVSEAEFEAFEDSLKYIIQAESYNNISTDGSMSLEQMKAFLSNS